ncbi:MAG: hypothetical protein L0F95_04425 [Lactococcus sp.]|jgi:predicted small secreted protein|uniref:PepSY domain-containing protein n=4 Tax=Pseudolactococcus TaxID=3436058 RepID=A0A7L4WHM7_9LACT|nr:MULTISPECIES: hypothetical protein [Lactococcus]MCJ1969085.1 hypothetical protein [Lactococcus carnosus]MCJ1973629.1 hypothetical protein [Lactococcus carnosus]MCJ1975009.1 hypothetical protein [Lactococcus carnosus]MCJ1976853.1 hypothetical protein [Lactococcus paracarnosus]MCJ1980547.1 hypothetical protein [Lactococcus carnosus]
MKKILKIGVGALVGVSLAVGVTTLYQKRKDRNIRRLLTLAKQHFMFDDILTSWIMTDPILFQIHEGGIIRSDGTVVTFEIDGDSLRIVETFGEEKKVDIADDYS